MFTLDHGTQLLRLFSEPTRLRLLVLLAAEQLTVAELTTITGLTQSRISTHLGRLRQAGLVQDDRLGNATLYSADPRHFSTEARQLWGALVDNLDDSVVHQDQERAAEAVRRRDQRHSWVESVAGRMERQYSPGRTWEATARTLIGLLDLGAVLDIASGDGVLADLLADHARHVTCLDSSATVIRAARERLKNRPNVYFRQGDMHALPFPEAHFDQVFLMHALTFTTRPQDVIGQAARVLQPGGALVACTLMRHRHRATVEAFDHVNLGFTPAQLRRWAQGAGLTVESAAVTTREQRPPYFEVISLIARRRP